MSDVIAVDHLCKRYDIGALQRSTMLREQLAALVRRPWRRRSAHDVVQALDDVSFRVARGEIVGIIGANGAGKSTLLKILSRITYPSSGRVQVSGRIASLLEVGTGFHEELTGRENIYLNGSILGMKRAQVEARLDEIVAFSGVERFLDTPIKRYSSGMRLRLGFAVAAHLDPDILVVDEVLAVGDAAFQRKCLSTMEGLRGGGRTVLFVSHNMAAVENLCTRAIWIDRGRLREDGPTAQVIQSYMGAYAVADAGTSDLKNFPGRSGSGDVRYTAIEMLDPEGRPRTVLRAGDPLRLRFHYEVARPLGNLSFGFRLFSEMGTLVTETSTRLHDIGLPMLAAGEGRLDLDIDALNLMPGRYYLTVGVTTIDGPVHDTLHHCARLDIEPGRVYGTGRVVDSRHGFVFFPQRWGLQGVRSLE